MDLAFDVDYINGSTTPRTYGMKRYQDELHARMKGVKLKRIEYGIPKSKVMSIVLKLAYPLQVMMGMRRGVPKHLTTQFLAYLLLLPGMENSVVTVYDTIFVERSRDFPLLTRLFIRLNIAGMKKARRIVTISDYSARQIELLLGIERKKITVIKPGMDCAIFSPGARPAGKWRKLGSPLVLALGSEEPRQNIDKVITAVGILKGEFPEIAMIKAGMPQWRGGRKSLTGLVERLGLQTRVHFIDYVPEKELPSLYRSVDAFAYPCASAGWGLPPCEALACGVPTITLDCGPMPESVGNCAITLSDENPAKIADAIRKIVKDKKTAGQMVRCGLSHVKQLDWDAAAKKMKKIYFAMV